MITAQHLQISEALATLDRDLTTVQEFTRISGTPTNEEAKAAVAAAEKIVLLIPEVNTHFCNTVLLSKRAHAAQVYQGDATITDWLSFLLWQSFRADQELFLEPPRLLPGTGTGPLTYCLDAAAYAQSARRQYERKQEQLDNHFFRALSVPVTAPASQLVEYLEAIEAYCHQRPTSMPAAATIQLEGPLRLLSPKDRAAAFLEAAGLVARNHHRWALGLTDSQSLVTQKQWTQILPYFFGGSLAFQTFPGAGSSIAQVLSWIRSLVSIRYFSPVTFTPLLA